MFLLDQQLRRYNAEDVSDTSRRTRAGDKVFITTKPLIGNATRQLMADHVRRRTGAMAARRALLLPWVALVCAAHSAGGSVQIFGEVSFDMRVGDRNEHDNGDEMQKILQDEDSRQQFTESLQIDSIEIKKLEARRDSDVGLSDDDDAAANGTGAINTGGSNSSNTADGGNSYTKYIRNITAAFQEDSCNYQFPERRQTNAMLSNMMNQLTKVNLCCLLFLVK